MIEDAMDQILHASLICDPTTQDYTNVGTGPFKKKYRSLVFSECQCIILVISPLYLSY